MSDKLVCVYTFSVRLTPLAGSSHRLSAIAYDQCLIRFLFPDVAFAFNFHLQLVTFFTDIAEQGRRNNLTEKTNIIHRPETRS